MAGLGHGGAFGHAGVVAGDTRVRDQLLYHQGYGLGCQAGFVDMYVPVHRADERSFRDLEDLHPSFGRPYRARLLRRAVYIRDLDCQKRA